MSVTSSILASPYINLNSKKENKLFTLVMPKHVRSSSFLIIYVFSHITFEIKDRQLQIYIPHRQGNTSPNVKP